MIRSVDIFPMKSSFTTAIVLSAVALMFSGCGNLTPEFRPNIVQLAENDIAKEHRHQIAEILEAMFGTPDEPYVLPETGLDLQKITMAAGPVRSDETGAKRGLFREHCAHCHGVTGDGMGPTAAFLKPYPRDYRQGEYKFKSTAANYPPTHDDLMRVVNEGITGTAMPSFKLLPPDQVEALVEYVKYLSFRGQTEIALIKYVGAEVAVDVQVPATHELLVGTLMRGPAGPISRWSNLETRVTKIPDPPANFGTRESIAIGEQVFRGDGGCVKCHGPTALGDGTPVWDNWSGPINKIKENIAARRKSLEESEMSDADRAKEKARIKELTDAITVGALPPREGQPRNLRQGIFRGGREPFELFYRLHNGILASAMPGIATTPNITPDKIWHAVDYVLALPYEPGSQYVPEVKAPPRERL